MSAMYRCTTGSMQPHEEAWKIPFYNALWKDMKKWLRKTRDFNSNISNFAALVHEHYRENVPKKVLAKMWEATCNMSEHNTGSSSSTSLTTPPPAYVNWVGCYLMKHYFIEVEDIQQVELSEERCLFLGPFSGRPAVPIIPLTRGVCGHAVRTALAHDPAPPLLVAKKRFVDATTLTLVSPTTTGSTPTDTVTAADTAESHHDSTQLEVTEWLRILPAVRHGSGEGETDGVWTCEGGVWVPDVHTHPDHIACDAVSMSELVCPIYSSTSATMPLVAIIDVDSPYINAFSAIDYSFFNSVAWLIAKNSPFCHISCSKAVEVAVPVEEHVGDMIKSGDVACGAK